MQIALRSRNGARALVRMIVREGGGHRYRREEDVRGFEVSLPQGAVPEAAEVAHLPVGESCERASSGGIRAIREFLAQALLAVRRRKAEIKCSEHEEISVEQLGEAKTFRPSWFHRRAGAFASADGRFEDRFGFRGD